MCGWLLVAKPNVLLSMMHSIDPLQFITAKRFLSVGFTGILSYTLKADRGLEM